MNEYRASATSLKVKLVALFAFFFVLSLIVALPSGDSGQQVLIGALLATLFFTLLFGTFFFVIYRSFRMRVLESRLEIERVFITRDVNTLEFSKLEGISVSQGPFARAFNYGALIVSGTGTRSLRSEPVDRPQEVAEGIRSLIGSRTSPAPAMATTPAGDTKKCPYCAEDIQAAAIKCKHCGEMLNA